MDSKPLARTIKKVILLDILLTIRIHRKKTIQMLLVIFYYNDLAEVRQFAALHGVITGIDHVLFNTLFEKT